MSWQDRDYASEEGYRRVVRVRRPMSLGRWSLSTIIIIINVVIFVLDYMTRTPRGWPLVDFGAMSTPEVLHGEVWRLITSQYLHVNTWHLFLNMLALYFLGRYLEQFWGRKRFFLFYTTCGVAGNLFFMLTNLIGWLPEGQAIGASGCILGVLGACAVLFPGIQLLVYFFPMRIRTAAALFLGLYVLNLISRGSNAGGDAAHLAGLVVGAGYAYLTRHTSLNASLGGMLSAGRHRNHAPQSSAWQRKLDDERKVQQRVDEILTKIQSEGIESLSQSERDFLSEASRQQQADERRYGRTDRL